MKYVDSCEILCNENVKAKKLKRLAEKYKALLKNDGEKLTLRNKNFRYRWS
ncbi:MAG: hypothetical protein K2F89_09700 [Treponemataceae bacterium]|nr:hypothetical protein [Treponemataceae bacterium]